MQEDRGTNLYAEVVVDISSKKLDRLFVYRVPDALRDQLEVGHQVLVPFGNGDRQVRGIVVHLESNPHFEQSRIKDISQILDRELSVETQLIQLAWKMKAVYGGTMNQALKTVFPVHRQVKRSSSISYSLVQDEAKVQSAQKRYAKDQRFLNRKKALEVLQQAEGPLSLESLEQEWHISRRVLDGLVADGAALKVLCPVKTTRPPLLPVQESVELNAQQEKAVEEITSDKTHRIHLLYGITGSGKTEVYMELIEREIEAGRQAIVLIPEISLSLQTVSRFSARFQDRVAIMNSRLSEGEKYDQYMRVRRGEVDLAVGPRSALFMPFERLGLIIVDEEHDGAYKSEVTPRFHARDVAAWRARLSGAKLLLGSATPSLETYTRALSGKYGLHVLQQRARKGSLLPQVTVVDMREEFQTRNRGIFSRLLHQKIEETLARGEQVMLFLNRRGYAGFVSCRNCGYVFKCRHCDVSLTAHQGGILKCHYCGYEQKLPKTCPSCGSPYIAAFGMGTQKVERMVAKEFPHAKCLRLDRDAVSKKNSMDEILGEFRRHEADILIGTQMIVKGHDFPDVTLVGVLAADLSIYADDYRASERTFQLLTQAAGRSGRSGQAGQVVIQTYQPDHYSIRYAARQDYPGFYQEEMKYRRLLGYPPILHMMAVLVTGKQKEQVDACSKFLVQDLLAQSDLGQSSADQQSRTVQNSLMQSDPRRADDSAQKSAMQNRPATKSEGKGLESWNLVGPADALVSKGKDVYRRVFYIKHRKVQMMIDAREYLENRLRTSEFEGKVQIAFDLDPMSAY